MSVSQHDDPARERLLDASLSEVFGRCDASPAEPVARLRAQSLRHRWLAAALLVLGSAVVTGSWAWSKPAAYATNPANLAEFVAQGPVLPETVCSTIEELEAAPADIVSLRVTLPSAKDLERLARFTALRELRLLGKGPGTFWTMVSDDRNVLNPLQKLQRLEKLALPPNFALLAAHVDALASIKTLRSVAISGSHPLGDDIARALSSLPSLRELRLHLTLVQASFLENLVAAQLTTLRFEACCNMGAAEFDALTRLRSLQSLAVMFAGIGSCSIDGQRYKIHDLGQAAFDAMNKLPNLIALDLDESQFRDKFMAQLPTSLRYLRLGDHVMNPLTIAALQRLDDLEELRFNHALLNDDAIELLQKLRLRRLWVRGWHNDDLVQAIADHLTLEHVTLRLHGQKPVELAALANAPKLRQLTLRYDERMDKPALPSAVTRQAFVAAGVAVEPKPF